MSQIGNGSSRVIPYTPCATPTSRSHEGRHGLANCPPRCLIRPPPGGDSTDETQSPLLLRSLEASPPPSTAVTVNPKSIFFISSWWMGFVRAVAVWQWSVWWGAMRYQGWVTWLGGGSEVLALGEFFGVDEGEHGLVRGAEHGDQEAGSGVCAVVAVLVVDDVAAGFPEGLAGLDDAFGLAFQLEEHFALQDVAEGGARVAVGRGAGVAGRELDDDRHRLHSLRHEGGFADWSTVSAVFQASERGGPAVLLAVGSSFDMARPPVVGGWVRRASRCSGWGRCGRRPWW